MLHSCCGPDGSCRTGVHKCARVSSTVVLTGMTGQGQTLAFLQKPSGQSEYRVQGAIQCQWLTGRILGTFRERLGLDCVCWQRRCHIVSFLYGRVKNASSRGLDARGQEDPTHFLFFFLMCPLNLQVEKSMCRWQNSCLSIFGKTSFSMFEIKAPTDMNHPFGSEDSADILYSDGNFTCWTISVWNLLVGSIQSFKITMKNK